MSTFPITTLSLLLILAASTTIRTTTAGTSQPWVPLPPPIQCGAVLQPGQTFCIYLRNNCSNVASLHLGFQSIPGNAWAVPPAATWSTDTWFSFPSLSQGLNGSQGFANYSVNVFYNATLHNSSGGGEQHHTFGLGCIFGKTEFDCSFQPGKHFDAQPDEQLTPPSYLGLLIYNKGKKQTVPLPLPPLLPPVAPWQNASLPIAERTANLISLLTLEEKASLLFYLNPAIPRLGLPAFNFGIECQRGVRGPAVPVMPFPSGAAQSAAFNVSLVAAIAQATALQARANFNVLTSQGQAAGGTACFGPTMNLVRHPTFGRANEMLGGESPYLAGTLSAAFAKGLQSFRAVNAASGEELWMIATVAKHLAVYSGPEGNYGDTSNVMPGMVDARYNATTDIDERSWREYYLPAWRAVAVEGGAIGFMSSYQALRLNDLTPATAARMQALGIPPGSAIPDTANPLLLTDEVRGSWGAPGYVISDAGAILCTGSCRQSMNGGQRGHAYAANASDAAVKALSAGVDLEISCCGLTATYPTLPDSVREGRIEEAALDRALGRILPWRFRTGTLDPPTSDPWRGLGAADMATPAMAELAADAARQGVILLKNEGALLPLSRSTLAGRTIAVLGPGANDTLAIMGSYSYIPTDGSLSKGTPWAALAAALPGANVQLLVDPLCTNAANCSTFTPSVVAAAGSADVVVAVLGTSAAINDYTCPAGESYNEKEECDRADAGLPGGQLGLLQALAALGRPLILVLQSGGALEVDWAADSPAVPAILHAPFLGVYSGQAIADALLGVSNPAGRVAATWYTRAGLQAIGGQQEYRMRPDEKDGYPGRTHLWVPPTPALVRYPFGFGLSYGGAFVYTAHSSSGSSGSGGGGSSGTLYNPCDTLNLTITLANTGGVDSDEVVQAYAALPDASFPAPRRTLVDFYRVRVSAGGAVNVSIVVTPRARSILREGDLVRVTEPGRVQLWIGGCSDEGRLPGVAVEVLVTGSAVEVDQCA